MTFDLRLELEHATTHDSLHCEISVNNSTLFDGLLEQNWFNFTCAAQDKNILRVYMHNKHRWGTKVDQEGNILLDTHIKVKSVYVDRRSFKYILNDRGTVYPNEGDPQLTSNYIAQNGFYELEFTLPIKKFMTDYYDSFDRYQIDTDSEIKKIDEFLERL